VLVTTLASLRGCVRERIFPRLVKGLARAGVAEPFAPAVAVLFRLLAIAWAEARSVWPGLESSEAPESAPPHRGIEDSAPATLTGLLTSAGRPSTGDSLRQACDCLWRAFAQEDEGALLAGVRLPDTVMGPVLRDLLIDDTPAGPVIRDFSTLALRDFGTLYEGLLDRGARKAGGSWFTPAFAIDHLLDGALEPALADHLARLDGLDDAAAGERLFAFRVADLAMGSGHFLLAALDRIADTFSHFLARRPLPSVSEEIGAIRPSAPGAGDAALLRRLVARRCLFGMDVDPGAAMLARLCLGLCTHVGGLPLSDLDGHLIAGDALAGGGLLDRVAAEHGGFDVLLGNPPWQEATVEEHAFWARHQPGLRGLPQRVRQEKQRLLRQQRPDLVARYREELAVAAATRRVLASLCCPGMTTGDPDLYKAFCWRFWQLARPDGGRVGLVLPRSALSAKGAAPFRAAMLRSSSRTSLTLLVNTGGWVFPDAEPRYTIALATFDRRREPQGGQVSLAGPFASLSSFHAGAARAAQTFAAEEVLGWTDSGSLPALPDADSLDLFTQLRRAPRLDIDEPGQWRARPHRELDATNDRALLDLVSTGRPPGAWPVYTGESFDLWSHDTGRYYAWADPVRVCRRLQEKRRRAGGKRGSPIADLPAVWRDDPTTLPCRAPRIAFRDVARATDSRTVRAALIPPEVVAVNQAPYLLWPRGDEGDQAYLLGVLSSLPLDWYARRFVETHVNFFLFNPLPVPRPARRSPLRRRVVALAGRLAAADGRFAGWAGKVGVACGPLADDEKQDLIHELDAVVARLYGLSERQLVHVFATFHAGWDHAARLDATRRHFRA
jgi:hypothetical protein